MGRPSLSEEDKQARRQRYLELFRLVPGASMSEKIDWVAEKLQVSRTSARSWSAETTFPCTEPNMEKLRKALHAEIKMLADSFAAE